MSGGLRFFALLAVGTMLCRSASVPGSSSGRDAFERGDYVAAVEAFETAANVRPSVASFHNLGTAHWHLGRVGPAVLAWERALWLDPFAVAPAQSLEFARHHAQLEAPAGRWHEAASRWLPRDGWVWLAMLAFWAAVAAWLLPIVLGARQRDWWNGVAAASLGIFLLTLPALAGVASRTALGVILDRGTALRLTPTREAQVLARLGAGEVVRVERRRGDYLYVRLGSGGGASGWITGTELGRISGN